MHKLMITRPDDWHVHLRDSDYLQHTVPATAKHFARALVMPNLKNPLTELESIINYRDRILSALPQNTDFQPFMTFYLNESVSADHLEQGAKKAFILGGKLYPAGATTHSKAGVKSLKRLYPQIKIMEENDLVLQIHGEVTQGDIFDREALFIEEHLIPLINNFPKLRIVLEHISTQAAVGFIKQAPERVSATITPHHLLYNRNQLLVGGIKPHYYCLPILKRERDQEALQQAAFSGNPKFFAGTDSAPHSIESKESACGCAGIYSAPYALALYTQCFDYAQKLDKLNAFMSVFGAEFYQQPLNTQEIELIKKPQIIPQTLPLGHEQGIPIAAGEQIMWSVNENT